MNKTSLSDLNVAGNGRDLLIVRADRREPLVLLPLRLAAEVALYAERSEAVLP
jgi:hypothetical protein